MNVFIASKKFLFLFIAVYMLAFFFIAPPVKNFLPVLWMLVVVILLFTGISKGRELYEYICDKHPEHKASFKAFPGISVSKTLREQDIRVKETTVIINKLYYNGFVLFFGFIIFHVGVSFFGLWV